MNFLTRQPPKTFKPHNRRSNEAQRTELMRRKCETLGSGNLRQAVRLPDGESENEWIAANVGDFFKQVNLLCGVLASEHCTEPHCPMMRAGPKYEYFWADSSMKKPLKCSAPKYIHYLLAWVQAQLEDESVFPSDITNKFPGNFSEVAKKIMKRLFRVYAHVYYHHIQDIESVNAEAHLNTSFKHFMLFVQEFDMIEQKELQPLQVVIEKLLARETK